MQEPHSTRIIGQLTEGETISQTATKNSLKTMVLQTLARVRKKLESITPRVKGSNTFSATPSAMSQMINLSRAWGNHPLDG